MPRIINSNRADKKRAGDGTDQFYNPPSPLSRAQWARNGLPAVWVFDFEWQDLHFRSGFPVRKGVCVLNSPSSAPKKPLARVGGPASNLQSRCAKERRFVYAVNRRCGVCPRCPCMFCWSCQSNGRSTGQSPNGHVYGGSESTQLGKKVRQRASGIG